MDTIHHLLRLNVEIEGALLVLANRDNEIALRILDEKTKEFSEIVDYLAHPEEKSFDPSEKEVSDFTPKAKDNIVVNTIPTDKSPVLSNVEKSETFEAKIISSQFPSEDNGTNSYSEEDLNSESAAMGKVLKEEKGNIATSVSNDLKKDNSFEKQAITEKQEVTELQENKRAEASEPINASVGKKEEETTRISSPQREKIRLDEMLSRKEARNLSKAFTINDRFRFQLHIFDGDKEAFNNTLEVLSSLNDYDSAITYLSGILDIDTEDQDTADFLAIVQNHFGVR